MCYVVESGAFVSLLLEDNDSISTSDILRVRNDIVQKHPDFIIDTSCPTINELLYFHSSFFTSINGRIIRNKTFSSKEEFSNTTRKFFSTPQRIIEALGA